MDMIPVTQRQSDIIMSGESGSLTIEGYPHTFHDKQLFLEDGTQVDFDATKQNPLSELLKSEEKFYIPIEVGKKIEHASELLERGDGVGAISMIDDILDSDEMSVEMELGDELSRISTQIFVEGAFGKSDDGSLACKI